jgi:phosphoribosylaminoimidazole-succinocarboxamide synthase
MTFMEPPLQGLRLLNRGKVRDIYDFGDNLLMVASDRISAFDVVMPDPVPDKGKVLTQISLFWFEALQTIVPNHLLTSRVEDFPAPCRPHAQWLDGRSMLVRKARPLSIECVVRGYLSGSGWESYRRCGEICGIGLPPGLREAERLPQTLFTPSTKEELGAHDINISFAQAAERIGPELAEQVRQISLRLYEAGAELAEEKGIIIADTKFEFGLENGRLLLIDEVLTPDSSRFWPRQGYAPGRSQESFDKQYLRDHLTAIGWQRTPPAPRLPAEVIENTRSKYIEALQRITGRGL